MPRKKIVSPATGDAQETREDTGEEAAASVRKPFTQTDPFIYKKLYIRLTRPMLGTCTDASIYNQHVLQKSKKLITIANRMSGKLTKLMAKYKGPEITEEKEYLELRGILRTLQEKVGNTDVLPDTIEGLLTKSGELEAEFEEMISEAKEQRATVFMRDAHGHAIISTHMILGNLKENLRIVVNNDGDGPKKDSRFPIKYKATVGEIMALDVKSVDEFMRPSQDIIRGADGKAEICERTISMERMGKKETAIALSEQLPAGAIFSTVLRIREGSPIISMLDYLFALGQNNGLGAWRGSGHKGAYEYHLEDCAPPPKNTDEWWKQ